MRGPVPFFAKVMHVIMDIDKKPWQDAVKPVWDKYGAKYAAMVTRIDAVK